MGCEACINASAMHSIDAGRCGTQSLWGMVARYRGLPAQELYRALKCVSDPPDQVFDLLSKNDAPTTCAGRFEACEFWCVKNTSPWDDKCTWKECSDCDACSALAAAEQNEADDGPKVCESWCAKNEQPWGDKCGWKECS